VAVRKIIFLSSSARVNPCYTASSSDSASHTLCQAALRAAGLLASRALRRGQLPPRVLPHSDSLSLLRNLMICTWVRGLENATMTGRNFNRGVYKPVKGGVHVGKDRGGGIYFIYAAYAYWC